MAEPAVPPRLAFDAPAGQPGSRRIGSLTAALRREMAVGPVTRAEAAGIAVAAVVAVAVALLPVDWYLQLVLSVGLGTLAGTEVARRSIPRRVRQALEAFGHLGEWELDRAAAQGIAPIASEGDARRWLELTPERSSDRWFRWEMALLAGQLVEAAAVAERMPTDTPYDRFERAYAIDRVRWVGGGESDLETLRSLAAAVGPLEDPARLYAETAVAIAEATECAAVGRSPLPPLVAARQLQPSDVRLGPRYVSSLRMTTLAASVFLSLVVPATITLVRAILRV